MSDVLAVYLDGERVGRLSQAVGGSVTFVYDDVYRTVPDPTPLSLSMPLAAERHPNRVVTAWIEGLLPDNAVVRDEWGRRFGVSPRNAFALLRHVGRDAAGAVQILPPDVNPPDAAQRRGNLTLLDDDQVIGLLEGLSVDERGWEVGARSGRWSLAGAQNKVALHRLPDGTWAVPNDATPTTHILKPTRSGTRFDDLHVNEFLCLRAAAWLGLRAAHVELASYGRARVLVAQRYDRGRDRSGAWLRLHQEDLLQAMSYRPERKYQEDGGPSLKQIAQFLSRLARADRDGVRRNFFELLAFNVLVGGTDAHAKNYSLLLRGARVAMAPLYDAASYAPYLREGEPLRSSMKVGANWLVRDVTADDWRGVGVAFGLDPEEAEAVVERLRSRLPEAVFDSALAAPEDFQGDARRIAETIVRQSHLQGPPRRALRGRRH